MKKTTDKHNQSQRSYEEYAETHESSIGEEYTGTGNNHDDTDRTSVLRTRSSTARNTNRLDVSSKKASVYHNEPDSPSPTPQTSKSSDRSNSH